MVRKRYIGIFALLVIVVICVVAAGFIMMNSSGSSGEEEQMKSVIADFSKRIDGGVREMENQIGDTATELAKIPSDDPSVSGILMDFYTNTPTTTGVLRINENGVITAIAPSTQQSMYKYLIPQNYISKNLGTYGIFIDHLYNLETGDTQIVIGAPIYMNGQYTGMMTGVINPVTLIGPVFNDAQENYGYNTWVIDEDGTILYNKDTTSIGMNIQSAASIEWPELLPIIPQILKNESGSVHESVYSYAELRSIDRVVVWETINIWEEDLKIVVANDMSAGSKVAKPTKTSGLTLEQYAYDGYKYVRNNGKEAALKEFSNQNGQFFTTDFMMSALDMNETILADAYRSDLVGVNRAAYQDSYSVPIYKMLSMRAAQGGGYTLFLYSDPQNNMQSRMLLSYIIPVDEDWYIVAGAFLDEPVPTDPELKQELAIFARTLHQFIEETGRDAAIASLNSQNEDELHSLDIQYAIFDYNGVAHVWPNNPGLVGEEALGVTDVYGGSIVRDVITYAKEGGGYMYQYMPDPNTGESSLKLVYVEPLGDEWFIAASVSLT